jgi:hypothetical protein
VPTEVLEIDPTLGLLWRSDGRLSTAGVGLLSAMAVDPRESKRKICNFTVVNFSNSWSLTAVLRSEVFDRETRSPSWSLYLSVIGPCSSYSFWILRTNLESLTEAGAVTIRMSKRTALTLQETFCWVLERTVAIETLEYKLLTVFATTGSGAVLSGR